MSSRGKREGELETVVQTAVSRRGEKGSSDAKGKRSQELCFKRVT